MFGGNRGSSASGDISSTAYSADVIVNPDVLDFHATDAESLHSPPLMTYAEAPVYPYSAVQAGIEGRVLLNLLVGRSGMVVSVENSSAGASPLLVDAAVRAARKWEFAPARRDGAPIACRAIVEVTFNLSDVRNEAPGEIGEDNN
jgi:TonB family protein